MQLIATVLCALATALSLATLFFMFVALTAERELEKSEFVNLGENCIEVFANYENLEYYIRCILLVYAGTDVVTVVYLNRNSRHFEEEAAIAEAYAIKNDRIRLEWIEYPN